VLTWEPPRRLVLSWQITTRWEFDPNFITEVEVTFTPEGLQRTRVELEHRNLERYGATAADLRKEVDSDGGWALILEAYREQADREGKQTAAASA
jgi:uncharacterized protein YndB with AHSA1/START domain